MGIGLNICDGDIGSVVVHKEVVEVKQWQYSEPSKELCRGVAIKKKDQWRPY